MEIGNNTKRDKRDHPRANAGTCFCFGGSSCFDTSSWQPLNQELLIGLSIPIKTESDHLLPWFPCSKSPIWQGLFCDD